jgi:hypothetical protein
VKIRYTGILLILIVMAALAVAGCSGGNTSATATPTPPPGGSTMVTPAPTATAATATPGAGTAMTLSDLYSKDKFSWIEYKTTSSYAGQSMTMTMKMEWLGREMHEGKMMDHTRVTNSWTGSTEVWADPDAASNSSSGDYTTSKAPLTPVGPDTVTINGKTYECTKYTTTMTADNKPVQYTFWHSPEAPVPVQYEYVSEGGTLTTQLTGWG